MVQIQRQNSSKAAILGHSQVSTTADWYMHSNPEQRLDAITQYGAALTAS